MFSKLTCGFMICNRIGLNYPNVIQPVSNPCVEPELSPKSTLSALQVTLNSLCDELTNSDPTHLFHHIDTLVQNQSLETLAAACAINPLDALKQAKNTLVEADCYLQATKSDAPPSLRARFHDAVAALIAAIESVIQAITRFFESSKKMGFNFKSEMTMVLLALSTAIAKLVVPIFGTEATISIVAAFIAVIAALSIISKRFKPAPDYLPYNAENWTIEVRRTTDDINARRDSLDEIATILKMNRHPLLVGSSPVGNRITAKAFAQAIARGDYPELKDKVVFRYNTANLVNDEETNSLQHIAQEMGRHRKDMILVFDNIHMACKDEATLGDLFKTYLHGGEFPHVIGITTTEEYDAHLLSNTAFARQFDRVDIRSTDYNETLKMLSEAVLKSGSKPMVKGDALQYLYERSGGDRVPQPAGALDLLQRCIDATEKIEKSPNEQRLNGTARHLESLRAQAAVNRCGEVSVDLIASLEDQLKILKDIADQEAGDIYQLRRTRLRLNQVIAETYRSVLKLACAKQDSMTRVEVFQLKRFVVLRKFFNPILQDKIGALSEKLGVSSSIDRALIDRLSNTTHL